MHIKLFIQKCMYVCMGVRVRVRVFIKFLIDFFINCRLITSTCIAPLGVCVLPVFAPPPLTTKQDIANLCDAVALYVEQNHKAKETFKRLEEVWKMAHMHNPEAGGLRLTDARGRNVL